MREGGRHSQANCCQDRARLLEHGRMRREIRAGARSGALLVALAALQASIWGQGLPPSFDLRDVGGISYSTPVKSQTGGTCWTHGTLAAMESNLLMTGVWEQNGETGEPNLAEYHLDWWNGFNQHHNDDLDPPSGSGLEVHMGGDYRVASAYMVRGDGAVRDSDGQSYSTPPARRLESYHYYYPRHVEWFVDDLLPGSRDAIKQAVVAHGAIGTCMYWGGSYYRSATDSHYQPPSSSELPNHSIAIVGWDDAKVTQSQTPGAWLCKNSWGSWWSGDGHFWISYDDKHCCKEPEMGAVSFRDVVRQTYRNIYYHDTHGWRDTMAVQTAMNAFVAQAEEDLVAVSFFTAAGNVDYHVRIYRQFAGGQCSELASRQAGNFGRTGFHTVDLDARVSLTPGQPFYIVLELSQGGHAYDCTSEVPVLLGGKPSPPDEPVDPPAAAEAFEAYLENLGKADSTGSDKVVVGSTAAEGESLYWDGAQWLDLTGIDPSANFCIKGLTAAADLDQDGIPDETDPDDDNDGIPDDWEVLHGLQARDAGDAGLDPDGDGASSFEEWVMDTDPANRSSALRAEVDSSGVPVEVRFSSSSSRQYTLLFKEELSDNSWQPVPGAGPRPGVDGPDTLADGSTFPSPPSRRFYRLRVEVP